MVTRKDELIVYWAPYYLLKEVEEVDWNIIYNNPENIYNSFKKDVNKENIDFNIMFCPSFKDVLKNSFSFSMSVPASYEYSKEDQQFISRLPNGLGHYANRNSNFNGRKHLILSASWIFFSDESVDMEVLPPYFSEESKHLQYGSVAPGVYNIGEWFRPVNAEFILKTNVREFVIKENEPVMYTKFLTDRPVKFKRFVMNKELMNISHSCGKSPDIFGKNLSLSDRYKVFKNSSTGKKVAKKIKENLID